MRPPPAPTQAQSNSHSPSALKIASKSSTPAYSIITLPFPFLSSIRTRSPSLCCSRSCAARPTTSSHFRAAQELLPYSGVVNNIEQRDYFSILHHVFMFSIGSALNNFCYAMDDDELVAPSSWVRSLRSPF